MELCPERSFSWFGNTGVSARFESLCPLCTCLNTKTSFPSACFKVFPIADRSLFLSSEENHSERVGLSILQCWISPSSKGLVPRSLVFSHFYFLVGRVGRASEVAEHCLGKAFILGPSLGRHWGVIVFLHTVFSHSRPRFWKVHQKIWSKRLPQDRPLCWSSEAQRRMKHWSITRLMNTKEHFYLVSISSSLALRRLYIDWRFSPTTLVIPSFRCKMLFLQVWRQKAFELIKSMKK